jgi:hypothetical protein
MYRIVEDSSSILYLILHHMQPLRFHCVGGCLDRTQDCFNLGLVVRRSSQLYFMRLDRAMHCADR